MYHIDGSVFEGQYRDDQKNGPGKLISPKNTYEGNFVNNKPEGKGILTKKDGAVIKGYWKNG